MTESMQSVGSTETITTAIKLYFDKTCETFKEIGDYKNLLFATGLENNIMFNIDPNIGEFTVDAFRLGMMIYAYHYPDINFDVNLLSNEISGSIFTFADNKFNPSFVESVKLSIKTNTDFVISFLPRIHSSHWYTLCIQPNKDRLVIINPLQQTSNEESNFLHAMSRELFSAIGIQNMDVMIENAGIQTSCMSCGENSLMIALSILTNGEEGYSNLTNYLKNDHILNSLLDVYDISFNRKCLCSNCVGIEYTTFKTVVEKYKCCKQCNKNYGGVIGVNIETATTCIFCSVEFNDWNSNDVRQEKSLNKLNSELAIRNELIEAVRISDIQAVKKGCSLSEQLKALKVAYADLLEKSNQY